MSKRLQVVMDEEEFAEIEAVARRSAMSISEWVRQGLRTVRDTNPSVDVGKKLERVRISARHEFPSGEIDDMLKEIERGYLGLKTE